MRLDKYLADQTGSTRSIMKQAIRVGRVKINDELVIKAQTQVKEGDIVSFDGRVIEPPRDLYIMLHKPDGYLCATQDGMHPIVNDLLPAHMHALFSVGRLDLDTTGLVLLTNDGHWAQRITHPKRGCDKRYHVFLARPHEPSYIEQFENGIMLRSEKEPTLPAKLELINEQEAIVTISEGRYHQVKRMFAAVGNHVEELHRLSIGGLTLDDDLAPGEYRELTADEVAQF